MIRTDSFQSDVFLYTRKKKINVVCHTDVRYLTVHVYLYLMCSTAVLKGSLFREQNKLQYAFLNLLLYQSHVRLYRKNFSSVHVYLLCSCLLCFCSVTTGFLLLPVQVRAQRTGAKEGRAVPLWLARMSEGGRGDFQQCKWHLGTWAGVGTQGNTCLPAVLFNVSSVKSQMTLGSLFPVFIFRLASPICSHIHGSVRENYLFSFSLILLSKVQLKAKQTCLFWMSSPNLLDEAWRGANWDTGLGRPSLCVLSYDPGAGPQCSLAFLISVNGDLNSWRYRFLTLNSICWIIFVCFQSNYDMPSMVRSLIRWEYIF